MATHFTILAWEVPWTEGAWWATVHRGRKKSNVSEPILWRLVQSCIRKLRPPFFFSFNKLLKVLLYGFIMSHMTS